MKKLLLTLAGVAFALIVVVTPTHASAATSVADLLKQIAALQEQLKALQRQMGDLKTEIRAGLREGMTDEDVKEVQELLASDPDLYPRGLVTGYFGPMTKEAVMRFQTRVGLTANGEIDEDTREYMEELLHERFGGRVPPGLLHAPGIIKKIEDRLHAACTNSVRATGPFCKRHMLNHDDHDADEHGDNDDADDDSDDHANAEPVDEIRVAINHRDAGVEVEYKDGDIKKFRVNTTNEDGIIGKIEDETDLSKSEIEDVMTITSDESKSDSDIESITVTIDEVDHDARARVEYNDGDFVTFNYDTDDEEDIIEGLADDLDMDEDDVDDLVDFDHDEVDTHGITEINVTIDHDEETADAIVYYENGETDDYDFDFEDENDIIDELSDELDLDEDVIESLVDFH